MPSFNPDGKSFYAKSRIQFLAQMELIRSALERGYPMTEVWKELRDEGNFDAKYAQFVAYVRKHIKNPTVRREKLDLQKTRDELRSGATGDPKPSQNTTGPIGSKRLGPPPPKPFKWNPKPLDEDEIRTGIITSREF